MIEKVNAYVQKNHLLERQDRVIVGVSGGADSVCLLLVLKELQKELAFSMQAVHIHHGIRGASANDDEQFVRQFCQQEGIPLIVSHQDVPRKAKEQGLSEEEAGRVVRRQVLEQVAAEQGGSKIALAHHRDDNAETLLLNLCRGTGLNGLAGMKPQNGPWIRPLLCVDRKEIETYLKERGQTYRVDETNLTDHYTRNRIRHHVIPYLEENVNAQTVEHMTDLMEQMGDLGTYVSEESTRYRRQCTSQQENGRLLLSIEKFSSVPQALRPYVLLQILESVAGHKKDLGMTHVKALEDLLHSQVGRQLTLPYDVVALRCYEGVEFFQGPFQEAEQAAEDPTTLFRTRVFEKTEDIGPFPCGPYTKWFDYDIMEHTLELRHRESSDYLTINQEGDTQKLKQYFVNEKIPSEQRDQIWLAADGSHIMWVVGYRQNQAYQITDQTKHILEIVYRKGEEDG